MQICMQKTNKITNKTKACTQIDKIIYKIYMNNMNNVLFNDALITFYLRLYGVGHMVKDHSDSEKGNPLPPHGLLFPISSKGSFICIIQQTTLHSREALAGT